MPINVVPHGPSEGDEDSSLDQVKRDAAPLVLDLTEEVYQALLQQGVRFEGQQMFMADGSRLLLRPEENVWIRFVFDRMRGVEMIIQENEPVGKGQIILYPIENGRLRVDRRRLLPKAVGSVEESVMYLPPVIEAERLDHFQALVDGHFRSDEYAVRIDQPRKEGDGVTEKVGIYLLPEISGNEVYYNDLQPWDESTRFTDEEFARRFKQALNTLGISFRWE